MASVGFEVWNFGAAGSVSFSVSALTNPNQALVYDRTWVWACAKTYMQQYTLFYCINNKNKNKNKIICAIVRVQIFLMGLMLGNDQEFVGTI